ncbi:MAG TPA: bifunctional precorrin-2 dehydrogenase/sirohydrochlorin ferrochelatase [Methanobacteriaceae archaeon]|nr:bifunctional precorrin-2 dehydrogenase/sirohydrochlorin ferrochelatase [Methanobacteriaceae archaeon]
MGWTPLFLEMKNRNVLVVGAGEVGERRALRFLEAEANVTITGGTVSKDLTIKGAVEKPLENLNSLVNWAELVVVASGDQELNQKVAQMASNKLLNRADEPENGDLIVPSSFFIDDVQICIFTQGKSPLMAKELRKKIQKIIKKEDVLQLELQHFARQLLKDSIDNQKIRRSYLYQILNDGKIKRLLTDGDLEKAKIKATELIKEYSSHKNQFTK